MMGFYHGLQSCVAATKLLRLLLHALHGLWKILVYFPRMNALGRQRTVMAWSARLLQLCGVHLVRRGEALAPGGLLLVANHSSWLDVQVLHAWVFCRFVAKHQIATWPLIGMLASAANTLYIRRGDSRHADRVVQQVAHALQQGDVVAVFPEGTTSDGQQVLPFHRRMIQAAMDAPCAIQPVAITFVDATTGQSTTAAAYVGDMSLLRSVWNLLTSPPLHAIVHLGVPQSPSDGMDAKRWAQELRKSVADMRIPR